MTDNNDWMDEPIEYATYSPEDDKLRIYSDRVSTELYDVLKGLGFGRAYTQGCFFATWSPRREDMVLNLCDEIVDEESTLAERAEDRHARFATYQDNAASRSEQAHRASSAATEGIPFGQPILVGHHSEKRHRKAVETACRQADKAVEEARRSKYWNWRAAGVLRHASYATNVNVVRGRIKTLKAALRKKQRERSPDMNELEWMKVDFIESRHDILGLGKPYGTRMDELTPAERDLVTKFIKGRIDARQVWADRWIVHLEGRIEYWEVFVEEVTGESADTQLPLEKGGWVFTRWGHWAKIVRVNRDREGLISSVSIDQTSVPRWTPRIIEYTGIKEYSPPSDDPPDQPLPKPVASRSPELGNLDELQAQAQAQVAVLEETEVVVNYDEGFFATPLPLVKRMVDLAELSRATRIVLEPSAGDGRIAEDVMSRGAQHSVHCCEVNSTAREVLIAKGLNLVGHDFMDYELPRYSDGDRAIMCRYDRVIMNPPFRNLADIDHVLHAYKMLRSDGRLIAIMSVGAFTNSRKKATAFREWLDERKYWNELLPAGTFKEAGTNVPAYLVVIEADESCLVETQPAIPEPVTASRKPWAVTDAGLPLSITQDQLF